LKLSYVIVVDLFFYIIPTVSES